MGGEILEINYGGRGTAQREEGQEVGAVQDPLDEGFGAYYTTKDDQFRDKRKRRRTWDMGGGG